MLFLCYIVILFTFYVFITKQENIWMHKYGTLLSSNTKLMKKGKANFASIVLLSTRVLISNLS